MNRVPIAGIGQRPPKQENENIQEELTDKMREFVWRDHQNRLMINTESDSELDKSIKCVLNDIKALRIELAGTIHLLQKKKIVSSGELEASFAYVNEKIEASIVELYEKQKQYMANKKSQSTQSDQD